MAGVDHKELLRKFSYNVKVLQITKDSGEESPEVALVIYRICLNRWCFNEQDFPVDESFGVSLLIKWKDLGAAIRTLMQGKLLPGMEVPRGYYADCECSKCDRKQMY